VRKQIAAGFGHKPPSRGRLATPRADNVTIGLSERDFGRLEEKTHQTEARLSRLEDEVQGRNRESRAFVVSWSQVFVVVLFTIGASLGSAWLVLAFGG